MQLHTAQLNIVSALAVPALLLSFAPAFAATTHQAIIPSVTVALGAQDGTTDSFISVDVETDYVPKVVRSENGAASVHEEALKAQAVASRSFMYYKLVEENKAFLLDSTADQVYSPGGGGVNTPPRQRHLDAAAATEGEILRYPSTSTVGVNVAAFYRAGLRPDSDGSDNGVSGENTFPIGAPFGVAESGIDDVGIDSAAITYNRGRGGFGNLDPATQRIKSISGSSSSASNQGALSQNGSDFLADAGWNYVDILRFYYGADIRLEVVQSSGGNSLQHVKSIADFEVDEGYFANDLFSGQNRNLTAVLDERDTNQAHTGAASQRVDINYDETPSSPATPGFVFHSVAGLGPNSLTDSSGNPLSANVSAPVGVARTNIVLESTGSIGFWLKANTVGSPLGLTASIVLDDEEDGGPADNAAGVLKPVIADGQWYKYEWFLDSPLDFVGFAGGDSTIDGQTFSIDALRFTGLSDGTFFIDDVFWNPRAVPPTVIPEPGTLVLAGLAVLGLAHRCFLPRRAATDKWLALSKELINLFVRQIAISKNLPQKAGTDGFTGVNGNGGDQAVRMTQTVMAPFDADDLKSKPREGFDQCFAGNALASRHQGTWTRWMPTNSRRGCRGASARHNEIASRTRRISVSRDLACVWQPASAGTVATKYPASSRSTRTVYGSEGGIDLARMDSVYHRPMEPTTAGDGGRELRSNFPTCWLGSQRSAAPSRSANPVNRL